MYRHIKLVNIGLLLILSVLSVQEPVWANDSPTYSSSAVIPVFGEPMGFAGKDEAWPDIEWIPEGSDNAILQDALLELFKSDGLRLSPEYIMKHGVLPLPETDIVTRPAPLPERFFGALKRGAPPVTATFYLRYDLTERRLVLSSLVAVDNEGNTINFDDRFASDILVEEIVRFVHTSLSERARSEEESNPNKSLKSRARGF